eukprot:CAMPEP_0171327422 /NCGR_PEP_ID=MMETSP0816-20121228/118075_1 /TAXON_ID=420281 /ORGANISM="Proboscia inermis, Strain CCAP1064/1" /LENGTH=73 /DNA_ID=CAMNT_0011827149 /DNA_START=508 /DNA_END=729 /DNA_ORIENTATION=-
MAEDWAVGMCISLENDTDESKDVDVDVAWDTLWKYGPSRRHDRLTKCTLENLVTKDGVLEEPPSEFATPDKGH